MRYKTIAALAIILAGVAMDNTCFQPNVYAQEGKNGAGRFFDKVNDGFLRTFLGQRSQVAIRTLREQRKDFPDILNEEITTLLENALLEGDEDSVKTLSRRIEKDMRKPSRANLKSFVAWFKSWTEEGNLRTEKFKREDLTGPSETSYITQANLDDLSQGNRYAQIVLLWIYRSQGQYLQAETIENFLKNAPESANDLKKLYKEDLNTLKDNPEKENPFWLLVQGELEYYGIGTSRDVDSAVRFYSKAASLGVTQAYIQLARAINSYPNSKETQRFEAQLCLKRLLLINEDPVADLGIGLMYMNGEGVSRDHSMAIVSLLRSAEAGIPEAMFALGKVYENGGVGVPSDKNKANIWYAVAKNHGFEHLISLDAKREDVENMEKTITAKPDENILALARGVFKDIYKE